MSLVSITNIFERVIVTRKKRGSMCIYIYIFIYMYGCMYVVFPSKGFLESYRKLA